MTGTAPARAASILVTITLNGVSWRTVTTGVVMKSLTALVIPVAPRTVHVNPIRHPPDGARA